MSFEDLGVMPELIKAVGELGWQLPTPIQAESVPLILGGGDVLAAAETGSGKTGAFALPLLQICWETIQKSIAAPSASSSSPAVAPVLSVDDRDVGVALDVTGLRMQCRNEVQWEGCRGTVGVVKGKCYYEVAVADDGLARVGWATKAASFDLGTDAHGFGYGGTGKKSNKKQFDPYGVAYKKGDVVGCYLDADAGSIAFSVNQTNYGEAFQIPQNLRGFALYPAIVLKNAEVAVNFGQQPFLFPPKDGSVGLAQADAAHVRTSAQEVNVSKGKRRPIALIMEPSRELAEQTHDALGTFRKHLTNPSLSTGLFVGGVNIKPQISLLNAGVDIITGTPGRLLELIQSGGLDLSGIRFFVLDEADRLLDTGNLDSILQIYNRLKKSERLQVLLFSATLHSPDVRTLAEKICQFPIWVDLKGRDSVPDTVDLALVWADPKKYDFWRNPKPIFATDGVHGQDNINANLTTREAMSEAIKKLKFQLVPKIIDAHNMDQALIFCRTRLDCDNLAAYLTDLSGGPRSLARRYSCETLHSGKQGGQRKDSYQMFKDGEVKFLICTDVAARGLDIEGLPYVINVTLPDKPADFIHRIGRVGRADRMGLAISIVGPCEEKVWYHQCKSRGANCLNTNLLDQGGCCIWYNEPVLLKDIQQITDEILPLNDDFTHAGGGARYGQKRSADTAPSVLQGHGQYIRAALSDLTRLEVDAQIHFFGYHQCFQPR